LKEGKPPTQVKQPFVAIDEDEYEKHFERILDEVGELAT